MVFSEAELKKAVKHLAFDVWHFRCYVKLHKNTKLQQACPAARQAVLYSLLLHLRLLLDFFYAQPKKDDCWVGHFRVLPRFKARFQMPSETPAEVEEVRTNLNKRLVHLTATRWKEAVRPMSYYEKCFDGLDTLIDAFETALPEAVRTHFVEGLRYWEKNHPATMSVPASCEPK